MELLFPIVLGAGAVGISLLAGYLLTGPSDPVDADDQPAPAPSRTVTPDMDPDRLAELVRRSTNDG